MAVAQYSKPYHTRLYVGPKYPTVRVFGGYQAYGEPIGKYHPSQILGTMYSQFLLLFPLITISSLVPGTISQKYRKEPLEQWDTNSWTDCEC